MTVGLWSMLAVMCAALSVLFFPVRLYIIGVLLLAVAAFAAWRASVASRGRLELAAWMVGAMILSALIFAALIYFGGVERRDDIWIVVVE